MCVPDNSPVETPGESFTFILISVKEQKVYYVFPQIQSTFVIMSRWLNLIFVITIIILTYMYHFIFYIVLIVSLHYGKEGMEAS